MSSRYVLQTKIAQAPQYRANGIRATPRIGIMADGTTDSTLKDAVKAINATFSADSVSTVPEELQRTIEDFLERRQETDSQKLQEELFITYNKYAGVGTEKQNAFADLLRLLLPAIANKDSLDEWWALLIKPTLDTIGNKRNAIESAKELLLSILVRDSGGAGTDGISLAAQFTRGTLDAFFSRTRLPTAEGEVVSPEDEFIAHEWENVLVAFGKKKPRDLLLAIDEYLMTKDYRLQALSLLSSFVRLQPPHLHLVLETPLIQHLLNCLLIDTSATVVDLALTVLIMFIPHITSCLVSILPKLLLTYARVLCWDQYYNKTTEPTETAETEDGTPPPENGSSVFDIDESWEQLQSDVDTVDAVHPQANYLFTFLYGLFPQNFMTFVRKPRRYLKMKNYPRADDLDLRQGLVRTRTEQHRCVHLLHPNFFTTTIEDELTDNRWLKTDPADLVTECMSLCIAVSHSLGDPGPPPTTKLPEIPKAVPRKQIPKTEGLLSSDEETSGAASVDTKSNSWRNTQSTTITAPSTGFNVDKSSRASLPDLSLQSRNNSPGKGDGKDGDETSPASRENSPPRPTSRPSSSANDFNRLQGFAQTISRSPNPISALPISMADNTAALQREIMLLKNDLNFERYLKQQHLAHIGNLQRKSVSEATVASETENLLNTNKTLKAKLIKANDLYGQLKRETTTSRNQAKKYEEQLSTKLKAYREEEKRWQAEATTLKHDLETSKREAEHLKNLIVESELREQDTRRKLITLQRDFEDLGTLRSQLVNAQAALSKFEMRDLDFQRSYEDQELLRTELEMLKMALTSRDAERERSKKTYEQKISVLEGRLRTAQNAPGQGQLPASVQTMIESALAASNAKLSQLKKAHARLLQKYTDLELRNLELEAPERRSTTSAGGPGTARPNSVLSLTRYADDSALSGTALLGRTNSTRATVGTAQLARRPHAFSDPSFFEENLLPDNEDASQTPMSKGAISASLDRAVPQRFESLGNLRPQRSGTLPIMGTMTSQQEEVRQDTDPLGRGVHDFQVSRPVAPTEPLPSGRSAVSVESGESAKEKVLAQAQGRVYGRGMYCLSVDGRVMTNAGVQVVRRIMGRRAIRRRRRRRRRRRAVGLGASGGSCRRHWLRDD